MGSGFDRERQRMVANGRAMLLLWGGGVLAALDAARVSALHNQSKGRE